MRPHAQRFLIALGLSLAVFIPNACADDPSPIVVEGGLVEVVDAMLGVWDSANPPEIHANLSLNGNSMDVVFVVYDSRISQRVVYRDNCVATPYDRVIDCDFKLVDDLIHDFRLIEIYGRNKEERRAFYRRYLLTWIIGHELGHIAKKHGISHYAQSVSGMAVFDAPQQAKELEADAYAIQAVGNLETGPVGAYETVLDVTNSLVRKSLCPDTFPGVCARIPLGGVGLHFDYSATAKPIPIRLVGTHPAYVARFLRILYLSGVDTRQNSINYLASQAIRLLRVQDKNGQWVSLETAVGPGRH